MRELLLGHFFDEFVRVGNRGIHIFDEAGDVGLDFGGFAGKGRDRLRV